MTDIFIPFSEYLSVPQSDRAMIPLTAMHDGLYQKNPAADKMHDICINANVRAAWVMNWDLSQDAFGLARQRILFTDAAQRYDYLLLDNVIRIDGPVNTQLYKPETWVGTIIEQLADWQSDFGRPVIYVSQAAIDALSPAAENWQLLGERASIILLKEEKKMTKQIPQGKGIFCWQSKYWEDGDPVKFAAHLLDMGCQHVELKVTDGYGQVNQPAIAGMVSAIQAAGIKVYGWGYVYGVDWAGRSQAVMEANAAVKAVINLGLSGFFIDAEGQFDKAGRGPIAQTYMTALRSRLPDVALGLCSYRWPFYHAAFPWRDFLRYCDFHAPQVYWMFSNNAGEQLRMSVRELKALADLPFVPVGAAYGENGWRPKVAEMTDFDAAVHNLNLPGVSWWEWQQIQTYPEYAAAIKGYHWETPTPPAPEPSDAEKLRLLWEDYKKRTG